MQKGWYQTWKNLLFQHFEIEDITRFEKYLPKGCEFDQFEGKYYLGLVLMNMTNVRHKSMQNFVWFKDYNELNVRTYITYKGQRGVLFLSLDVDSFVSMLGARILYGLPYRIRKFERPSSQKAIAYRGENVVFQTEYEVSSKPKRYTKDSFAYWATERYFFANKYMGVSFMGQISHEPWELCEAKALNDNLGLLASYEIKNRHSDVLFCHSIDVQTNKLQRIY